MVILARSHAKICTGLSLDGVSVNEGDLGPFIQEAIDQVQIVLLYSWLAFNCYYRSILLLVQQPLYQVSSIKWFTCRFVTNYCVRQASFRSRACRRICWRYTDWGRLRGKPEILAIVEAGRLKLISRISWHQIRTWRIFHGNLCDF